MPSSARTHLRELYRYVGNDVMAELPSLQDGTSRWNDLLRLHPELRGYTFTSEKDLANWIQKHPQSGVSLSDFGNYEKALRYASYFPKGRASEELQHDLQVEQKNEEAAFEQAKLGEGGKATGQGLDYFAKLLTPTSLEGDRAFRRILKEVVKEHNRLNPNNQFTEKLIVRKGRDKMFNPNLPPDLLTKAKAVYGTAYGHDELAHYNSLEQKRIYRTRENDPVLRRMENAIKQEVDSRIASQTAQGVSLSEQARADIEKEVREKHTAQLVKDYPEKASVYAKKDPLTKEEFKKYAEARKKLGRLERERAKIRRFRVESDPVIQDLRNGRITPEEIVRKYPEKAKAYRRSIPELGEAWEGENARQSEEKERHKALRKLKDPSGDSELRGIKAKYPHRATDPTQQAGFNRDMEEFVRTHKRAGSKEYRADPDVKNAFERINKAQNYGRRDSLFPRIKGMFQATHAPAGLTTTVPAGQPLPAPSSQIQPTIGRFKRFRNWVKRKVRERYEKAKKKLKQLAEQYLTQQARQQAFQYLRQFARFLGRGAKEAASLGLRGASKIPSGVSSLLRPPPTYLSGSVNAGAHIGIPQVPFRIPPAPVALAGNPWTWVIIVVIIIILILLFIIFGGDNGQGVQVFLTKTGPAEVPNPDPLNKNEGVSNDITYTLNVSYSGNPTSITVVDTLPPEVVYVSADGPGNPTYNATNHTVTWTIPISGGGSGSSGSPATGTPPNLNATTFEELMRGQGRNIGILDDESNFIQTVKKNGGRRFPGGPDSRDQYLSKIYQKAVSANVNPLIVLTIWGAEASFELNGTEFGCIGDDFRGKGFDVQLNCVVDRVLDYWMKDFEQKAAANGLPVPNPFEPSCTYDDAFIYTFELATPVCSMEHGNGQARTNFVIIFKEFLQGPQ